MFPTTPQATPSESKRDSLGRSPSPEYNGCSNESGKIAFDFQMASLVVCAISGAFHFIDRLGYSPVITS